MLGGSAGLFLAATLTGEWQQLNFAVISTRSLLGLALPDRIWLVDRICFVYLACCGMLQFHSYRPMLTSILWSRSSWARGSEMN